MSNVFNKHGGYRRMHSFTLATIVQLETLRFCRTFFTHDFRESGNRFFDPKGRQYDQMTQAARSGRQNIIEGSERAATSKDTEMKLTDVARASLSELRGDYEIYLLDRGCLPWALDSSESQAICAVVLDELAATSNLTHASANHVAAQRKKYATWLDSKDPVVVANVMIIIISRAISMLKSQMRAQMRHFEAQGGFSEQLTNRRLNARAQQNNDEIPVCSKCGLTMRRCHTARGDFWGCSGYPACKTTQPIKSAQMTE